MNAATVEKFQSWHESHPEVLARLVAMMRE